MASRNEGNKQSETETEDASQGGGTKNRGFASMDPARQREIASQGGKAAHQKGTAHEFTSEEARRAGSMSHGNRQSATARTGAAGPGAASGAKASLGEQGGNRQSAQGASGGEEGGRGEAKGSSPGAPKKTR